MYRIMGCRNILIFFVFLLGEQNFAYASQPSHAGSFIAVSHGNTQVANHSRFTGSVNTAIPADGLNNSVTVDIPIHDNWRYIQKLYKGLNALDGEAMKSRFESTQPGSIYSIRTDGIWWVHNSVLQGLSYSWPLDSGRSILLALKGLVGITESRQPEYSFIISKGNNGSQKFDVWDNKALGYSGELEGTLDVRLTNVLFLGAYASIMRHKLAFKSVPVQSGTDMNIASFREDYWGVQWGGRLSLKLGQ